MPLQHAISIDLEYWYLGFSSRNIPGWEKFGSNDESIAFSILELLQRYDVKATFFVLGRFAEEYPKIVKHIASGGHEIATHGYLHKPVSSFDRETFRADLRHSVDILENLIQKKVIGHRATGWSLQKENFWALDILAEEGILYDSSIAPTGFHKYGVNNFRLEPHKIDLSDGRAIYEFPMQVYSFLNLRFPSAGGFYLRALPLYITKQALRQSEKRRVGGLVYFHPYDLDENTPKIETGFVFRIIRYYNLHKTKKYLNELLNQFKFCPIREIYINISSKQ